MGSWENHGQQACTFERGNNEHPEDKDGQQLSSGQSCTLWLIFVRGVENVARKYLIPQRLEKLFTGQRIESKWLFLTLYSRQAPPGSFLCQLLSASSYAVIAQTVRQTKRVRVELVTHYHMLYHQVFLFFEIINEYWISSDAVGLFTEMTIGSPFC